MAIRDTYVTGTSSFDVEEVRLANAAPWTPATTPRIQTGIKPGPGSPGAVTATSTPDGNVQVAPFQAIIQSTRTAQGGAYTFTNDATYTVNVLATPANATNPRNDLIIAHAPDTFYGDANSTPIIRSVVGTPSGSPADPSLTAYPDVVVLARVRVNANATTITNANITDLRPTLTVAVGGLLPTNSATTRNNLTGAYDGMPVYRKDRRWVEINDGNVWRPLSIPIVSSVADLSAITHPATGSLAYNTADDGIYRYNGGWRRVDWTQKWGLLGGRHYTANGGTLALGIGGTEASTNQETGNVPVIAGRRYKISARIRFNISNTGSHAIFNIREGAGGISHGYYIHRNCIGAIGDMFVMDAEYDETANSTKNFTVTAAVFQSTGLINIVRSANAGMETYVVVHDKGPALGTTV